VWFRFIVAFDASPTNPNARGVHCPTLIMEKLAPLNIMFAYGIFMVSFQAIDVSG
jgi:hypothetical protein